MATGSTSSSQLSISRFFCPSFSASVVTKTDDELNEELPSSECSNGESNEAEPSTVAGDIVAKKHKISHHRKRGVSSSWLLWLRRMGGRNGKIGIHFHLCMKHSVTPRSVSTSWTSDLCYYVRRDKVARAGCSSTLKYWRLAHKLVASPEPLMWHSHWKCTLPLGVVRAYTGYVNRKYHTQLPTLT